MPYRFHISFILPRESININLPIRKLITGKNFVTFSNKVEKFNEDNKNKKFLIRQSNLFFICDKIKNCEINYYTQTSQK